VDKGVWDVFVNGPFKPIKIVEGKTVLKEFSQWMNFIFYTNFG